MAHGMVGRRADVDHLPPLTGGDSRDELGRSDERGVPVDGTVQSHASILTALAQVGAGVGLITASVLNRRQDRS